MAVNAPPPTVIVVFTVAVRFVSEPFEITMPGLAEFPSTRLRLLPLPKLKPALP